MRTMNRKFLCTAIACTLTMSYGKALPVMAEDEKNEGKDETVYIITDASGTAENIIVSDWLKNTGSGQINDISDLKDIRNVSGEEAFTQSESGKVTWNGEGKDIYYQGTTEKELPINVKITYFLEGKEMSAKDIAGKAGHVKIRFDYENKTSTTETVNGKALSVQVPFAVVSGMELDTEKFSGINVTNGKLISEGKNTFVVGMAFPGLEESLHLSQDEKDKLGSINIPSYVEIEADTTDFEVGMTMTVASSDLLSDLDMDIDTSELTDAADKLEDAADQLLDGSDQLKDGTKELKDGTDTLKEGTGTLKNGTTQLKDGSGALKEGTSSLSEGAKALEEGVTALKNGTDAFMDGFSQLNEGIISADAGTDALKQGSAKASAGAEQFAQGVKTLSGGIETLDAGTKQLNAGAEQYVAMLKGNGTAENPGLEASVKQLYNGSQQLSGGLDQALDSLKDTQNNIRELEKMTAGSDSAKIAMKYNEVMQAAEEMAEAKAVLESMQKTQSAPKKSAPAKKESNSEDAEKMTALEEENEALKEQIASLQSENEALKKQLEEEKNKGCEAVNSSLSTPEIEEIPETREDAQPEDAEENTEETETETEPIPVNANDEMHVILLGNTPSTPQEAMQNLQKAKENFEQKFQEYTVLVTSSGDSVFASQLMVLDQTLNQIIGDETGGVTALSAGAKQLNAGLAQLNEKAPQIVSGSAQIAEGTKQLLAGIEEKQEGADMSLLDGAKVLAANADTLKDGAAQLDQGISQLQTGMKQLKDGAALLNQNSSALKDGAEKVLEGSDALKDGAEKVNDGSGQLDEGIKALDEGVTTLNDGAIKLADGAGQLNDGAEKLADGMKEFKEEGIDELSNTLKTKLPDTADRLEAVLNAGKAYRSFSGSLGSEDDRVKFIFRTDGVKKE